MAAHGNIIIDNRLIENERLELSDKDSVCFLGPDLTLSGCTIVLKLAARNLIMEGVQFINCSFEVKQELKNHQQWVLTALKGCRFKGKLSGCDFGHWPEFSGEARSGAIENCDLSEALLNGCRFMGCDERTLRFPSWPCFTFLDPLGHSSELRAAAWPEWFGRVVIDKLHTNPASTRAITVHAPSIARRMETTPEALRVVIEQFDCIVY